MKPKRLLLVLPAFALALAAKAGEAFAHCPLCVAGAAVAAGGAAKFGVNHAAIGIFIGAFAVSMGLWFDRLIKKQYMPHQREAITAFSFVSTVIPLAPFFSIIKPAYISIAGDYGSLLNSTYVVEMFFVSALLGGAIVAAGPKLSNWLADYRNKRFAYQGIIITFALLFFTAGLMQAVM